jgi:hypothetical protein
MGTGREPLGSFEEGPREFALDLRTAKGQDARMKTTYDGPMRPTKYVNGCRQWIYTRLAEKFGRGGDWNGKPPKGREAEYANFLQYLAERLTQLHGVEFTASGIGLQVKMATSKQNNWAAGKSRADQGQSLAAQVFLNKAAAYEAGFIVITDLPQSMAFFYRRAA